MDIELNSFYNEIDVSLSSSAYSSNNFSRSSDISSENEIIQEKNIMRLVEMKAIKLLIEKK